jgi:hypothetical protein
MSRRPLPPYLRLVVDHSGDAERSRVVVPGLARASGNVADLYLEPWVTAGRDIIEAAVAVVVRGAAKHGFTGRLWEPETVRDKIGELIAQQVHDTVVHELTGGEES